MTQNITFKLYKDTIIISQMKKDNNSESLNNTNVIDLKELKFSTDYIEQNLELVANFLNVVVIKNDITKVQINNIEIATYALDVINYWDHINTIIFKPDKKITFNIFLKLLDNKYIEEIECYEMPEYLIERLDINRSVKVKTRNQINFKSNFMSDNDLNNYSDIYYKKTIVIKSDFNKDEYDDLKTFMGINNHLKTIKILTYSNELLATIIEEAKTFNKENIKIEIAEKNNDLDIIYKSVNYIKKTDKKFIENNNISFKLNYSNEYKKMNFFKELNFKFLKYIIVFIIMLGFLIVGINYFVQYHDQGIIEKQIDEFNTILKNAETSNDIDQNNNDIEYIDKDETQTTTKKKNNYVSSYYTNFSQVFDNLIKKNKDTVGWLTVNDTKINYPVVQASTNSYYLNRDFYKVRNSMGWIFMDYRNNTKELDKNTIIYGHNIKTGIMFGTLKYALNSSWYKKAQNQIITFNTPTANMKWQIFAIYKIPATDDYLKNDFDTDEEYLAFLKMLKDRSIFDFKVDVNENSKILTLSTCNNHSNRTVVHAVLLEN